MSVQEHTVSEGARETEALGRDLGGRLVGGDVVLLRGELGAGKSVFARGIAMSLGADNWKGSPTFTLVNEYSTTPMLYHSDLYRLGPGEIRELGLEEYVGPDSVLLVEWPERDEEFVASLAERRTIEVEIEHAGPERRLIRIRDSNSRRGAGDRGAP